MKIICIEHRSLHLKKKTQHKTSTEIERDRGGQGQEASGEKLLAVHSGIDKKAENEKRFKMAQ